MERLLTWQTDHLGRTLPRLVLDEQTKQISDTKLTGVGTRGHEYRLVAVVIWACTPTRTEALGVKITTSTFSPGLAPTTTKALLREVWHTRVWHPHGTHLQKCPHDFRIERHVGSRRKIIRGCARPSSPHVVASASTSTSTGLLLHAAITVEAFVSILRVIFFAIVETSLS